MLDTKTTGAQTNDEGTYGIYNNPAQTPPSSWYLPAIPLLPALIPLSSRYHPAPIPPPFWYHLVTTRYNPILPVLIPLPITSIPLQSRSNPTTITVSPAITHAVNKNEPDSVEVRQTTRDTVCSGHTSQPGRPWWNHDGTRRLDGIMM